MRVVSPPVLVVRRALVGVVPEVIAGHNSREAVRVGEHKRHALLVLLRRPVGDDIRISGLSCGSGEVRRDFVICVWNATGVLIQQTAIQLFLYLLPLHFTIR